MTARQGAQQHAITLPPPPLSARVARNGTSTGTFVSPKHASLHPPADEPSFTFVCLGVGGGPMEGDCSCYLLKPAHRKWHEGSVVVEGGSWLGALSHVLEDVGPDSAFHDVDFPFDNPTLRAGFIGSFAHSFLLSHAHLDHILGMVLGSASLPGKRKVYGLKETLQNLMGVFNGKIWPKLASWEEDGAPCVYHLKAVESQAKMKIDDDLSIIPFALSHGLNPSVILAPPTPTHVYASRSSTGKRLSLPLNGYFAGMPGQAPLWERSMTGVHVERPVFTSPFVPEASLSERASVLSVTDNDVAPEMSPKTTVSPLSEESPVSSANQSKAGVVSASSAAAVQRAPFRSRRPRTAQGSEKYQKQGNGTAASRASSMASGMGDSGDASQSATASTNISLGESVPALDSTAFFITNEYTGKDVLFFGDVEPDSISRSPRNGRIWAHAAIKFAEGKLNTVFLECSFPASQPTEFLFGHLSVSHVFDELKTLATSVVAERKRMVARRQRRDPPTRTSSINGSGHTNGQEGTHARPVRFRASQLAPIPALHTAESAIKDEELCNSLQGLSVVIIHVKTALFPSFEATPRVSSSSSTPVKTAESEGACGGESASAPRQEREPKATTTSGSSPYSRPSIDSRSMQQRIEDELVEAEEHNGLGVRFVIAKQGMRIDC